MLYYSGVRFVRVLRLRPPLPHTPLLVLPGSRQTQDPFPGPCPRSECSPPLTPGKFGRGRRRFVPLGPRWEVPFPTDMANAGPPDGGLWLPPPIPPTSHPSRLAHLPFPRSGQPLVLNQEQAYAAPNPILPPSSTPCDTAHPCPGIPNKVTVTGVVVY